MLERRISGENCFFRNKSLRVREKVCTFAAKLAHNGRKVFNQTYLNNNNEKRNSSRKLSPRRV